MEKRKPRIGILALMLEDYLPLFEGIREKQTAYVEEVLTSLDGLADFRFPHVAMNRAEMEELVHAYNAEGLDGILIFLLTYAQGMYLVHAVQDNRLPLALALIQPEQTVRRDFVELDYTVNQGIHGSQDCVNSMLRAGARLEIFAGNRMDASFRTFVRDFSVAAMTRTELRAMRIGVIGKLPAMGDVFTDDMAIHRVLGPELRYDSIGTVYHHCAAVTEEAVSEAVAEDCRRYVIDPGMPAEVHREAARMYLGLKAYLEAGGYAGYTLHYGECGEDGRFTQLPLLAASNLMADGYGYAAEGDSPAAVLTAAMHSLYGDADFSEMYMMDFAREAILFAHQGEGNPNFCRRDKKPFLKNRILSEGGLSNPPTPIFTPEPGRAMVLSIVHLGGDRFRMLCMRGDILEEDGLLYVDMPYLFFRPDGGVSASVTRWLQLGGTHHEAIVSGDDVRRLEMLCAMLGVELEKI